MYQPPADVEPGGLRLGTELAEQMARSGIAVTLAVGMAQHAGQAAAGQGWQPVGIAYQQHVVGCVALAAVNAVSALRFERYVGQAVVRTFDDHAAAPFASVPAQQSSHACCRPSTARWPIRRLK
ncbi:hypothetical protein D3C80_1810900 [compost metagenome]